MAGGKKRPGGREDDGRRRGPRLEWRPGQFGRVEGPQRPIEKCILRAARQSVAGLGAKLIGRRRVAKVGRLQLGVLPKGQQRASGRSFVRSIGRPAGWLAPIRNAKMWPSGAGTKLRHSN